MPQVRLTPHVAQVGGGIYGISHEIDCNVYLLSDGDDAALVDAGAGLDPERIVANVRQAGTRRLRYILLTHAHADHACGAGAIQRELGGEVVAAEPDATLVERGDERALGLDAAKRSGAYPPEYRYAHATVDRRVVDGQTLPLGRFRVQALVLPSHSAGSTCYLVDTGAEGGRLLFTGDVVFVGGLVAVINVPGCDLGRYRENIRRLHGLGVDALFPGHLLWRLADAQRHLDAAVTAFSMSRMPKNLVSFTV